MDFKVSSWCAKSKALCMASSRIKTLASDDNVPTLLEVHVTISVLITTATAAIRSFSFPAPTFLMCPLIYLLVRLSLLACLSVR